MLPRETESYLTTCRIPSPELASDGQNYQTYGIEKYFTRNQTYQCLVCKNKTLFHDLAEGARHVERHHWDQPDKNSLFVISDRFLCNLCGNEYKFRNFIIGHLNRKHDLVVRPVATVPYTGITLLKVVREIRRRGAFRTVYPTIPSPRRTTLPAAIFQYYDKVINKLIESRRKLVRVRVRKTTLKLNKEDKAFFEWLDRFNRGYRGDTK
ncbi:uncharacterized protein LOC103509962 isoform X1 [Diaphorina citri]|uniref:Uncharacterized protein LOC103509962 isoform X1 n=1 Tax=Diaphorina citri TaxID=121845 RepID=A0A1S4ECQ4_DIACI|nr:uncharacterized protein LOC103509962 isoform X1 [Diaphorina citri]